MPPDSEPAVRAAAREAEVPITCIGRVHAGTGVDLVLERQRLELPGFDHFA
jgi:thiamine monophosphate kinase